MKGKNKRGNVKRTPLQNRITGESSTNQKYKKSNSKKLNKKKKSNDSKRLFEVLFKEAMSRRMAVTKIGYNDQTYMITQIIHDWIKQGKAFVIGQIKCSRSGRLVECISTNPELFPKSNQLNLFDNGK